MHVEFTHPPHSRARFSTGPGRAPCYRAGGSRDAPPHSTCCAQSGWCRRGAAEGSGRCGAGSRKCRRFWGSAPTLLRPSCRCGGKIEHNHWHEGQAPSCTASLDLSALRAMCSPQGLGRFREQFQKNRCINQLKC